MLGFTGREPPLRSLTFSNYRILVLVRGSTAAKQAQWFSPQIPQLVLLSGTYRDRVANIDLADFTLNSDSPLAVGDKINLLGPDMIMLLRAGAGRQPRLGQALVPDSGIPVSQQFPDLRTVLGDEGRDLVQIL